MKSEENKYMSSLNNLLIKLNLKSEAELIEMHKFAIAQQTSNDFLEKARNIILAKDINKNRKSAKEKNKAILDKFFINPLSVQEFVLSNLKESEFFDKIKKNLKEEQVKVVSEKLALEGLENEIKKMKSEKKIIKESFLEREKEPSSGEIMVGDPMITNSFEDSSDSNLKKIDNVYQKEISLETANMDEKTLEVHQILNQLKKKYLRSKIKFVKKNYEESLEPFDFFDKANMEDMKNNEFIATKEVPPNFKDIYDSVDYFLENVPLSIKRKIQKDAKEENLKFNPNFLNQKFVENDLLWDELENKFGKIIPIRYQEKKEKKKEKRSDEFEMEGFALDYDEKLEENEEDLSNNFTESDLSHQNQLELELFRTIRKTPFFLHHYHNNFRYFSDRMEDALYHFNNLEIPQSTEGDIINYEKFSNIPNVQFSSSKLSEPKKLKDGKIFCGGKRKTCNILCIIYPGKGRVTINRNSLIDYFTNPSHRIEILTPLELANVSCEFNIDFHVRGGGTQAQAEAGKIALGRCLVKAFPSLKKLFKEYGFLKTDIRQVERKKVGKYKARAKYPYQRR